MNLKPTDLAARAVLAELQALRVAGAELAAYEAPLAAALKVIDTTFPFFERMWTRNNVIAARNVVRDPAHHARGEADYWIGRAVFSLGQYLPPQPEAKQTDDGLSRTLEELQAAVAAGRAHPGWLAWSTLFGGRLGAAHTPAPKGSV